MKHGGGMLRLVSTVKSQKKLAKLIKFEKKRNVIEGKGLFVSVMIQKTFTFGSPFSMLKSITFDNIKFYISKAKVLR